MLRHDALPRRVVILSWRDRTHPEGGGAEAYAEQVAHGLARAGADVEIWCARHPGSGRRSTRGGVTLRHAGGRLGVYPRALLRLLGRRLTGRRPDVVVDVQNGVPFFARLVAGCPVVVLVHHVHREQWPIVFGRVAARIGWFLESEVSPRVHRGCEYVAVSEVTRGELVQLGVDPDAITVVHNGTEPRPPVEARRSPTPHLVVLGRLVPHKQVEHAVRVVRDLRREGVEVTLSVVGDGWWAPEIRAEIERCGVAGAVRLHGHVDERTKHELLASAWVLVAPSVKEGWGLMVVEAALHEAPAVAYHSSGGLTESVVDGVTGLLVADEEALTGAVRELLLDGALRARLGRQAVDRATEFTWEGAAAAFAAVLSCAVSPAPLVSARRTAPTAR